MLVQVASPAAENSSSVDLWLGIILALALVALLAFVVRWWLWRRVLVSVREVIEALRSGPTDRRADPTAGGLVGSLARGVNELARRTQHDHDDMQLRSACLTALLARLPDSVLISDERGRIIIANDPSRELLAAGAGVRFEESLSDMLAQGPWADLIAASRKTGKVVRRQMRFTLVDPPRTLQATAGPVLLDGRRRGMLLLLHDQTELVQNIQMKTDFVANASHELRTPLASIRAAVETIQESGLEDEALVKRCLNIIGGHVLRLQLLVQDLLDLSRTEDPRALVRFEPISLDDLRESLMTLFGHIAAARKLDLRFEAAPGVHFVRGDERLVMLIVKNLVDNSLKFTAAGHITVRWKRGAAATLARGPAGNPAVEVAMEVQDTGCGIAPEDRQRVFERFYTVNRSRGGSDRGTGLGLAIVKHAVAAMGGTVWLESEPGKGTTIRCSWPEPRGSAPSDAVYDDLADAPDA